MYYRKLVFGSLLRCMRSTYSYISYRSVFLLSTTTLLVEEMAINICSPGWHCRLRCQYLFNHSTSSVGFWSVQLSGFKVTCTPKKTQYRFFIRTVHGKMHKVRPFTRKFLSSIICYAFEIFSQQTSSFRFFSEFVTQMPHFLPYIN